MANEFSIIKDSGERETFSIEKLKKSLRLAHADEAEISAILQALHPHLHEGITSKKIYQEAFRLLRSFSRPKASRFYLKKGLMEIGPSGFPFEHFMAEIFKKEGYYVEINAIIKGKCVNHEIDVIAKKNTEIIFVECKYRNQAGYTVDVKTPLYIYARYQDILDNGYLQDENKKFIGGIATNTKFTDDALAFGLCKNMRMISWNYPSNNSLKDLIDKHGLYPLTCLTTLTQNEKQLLLKKGFVLARAIAEQTDILQMAGIKESRFATIQQEAKQICQDATKNKLYNKE